MPRDAREAVLASAASSLLGEEHVLARPIDDSVSKEAFHRLIEDLDEGKLFLLEADVQKLARFETDKDDQLRAGDLVLGRKAAALLAGRRRLVADLVARILAAPLEFTANESIETDTKKRAIRTTLVDPYESMYQGVRRVHHALAAELAAVLAIAPSDLQRLVAAAAGAGSFLLGHHRAESTVLFPALRRSGILCSTSSPSSRVSIASTRRFTRSASASWPSRALHTRAEASCSCSPRRSRLRSVSTSEARRRALPPSGSAR